VYSEFLPPSWYSKYQTIKARITKDSSHLIFPQKICWKTHLDEKYSISYVQMTKDGLGIDGN
jgi:hypothetical protein